MMFGMPMMTSKWLGGETAYADWRRRLERWLAPTARIPQREPLTKRNPDLIMFNARDPFNTRQAVAIYCSERGLTALQRNRP